MNKTYKPPFFFADKPKMTTGGIMGHRINVPMSKKFEELSNF
jgi:hypothetical protein